MRTLLILVVGFLIPSEWVSAQSRSRPDPADPSAATPRPDYQPAFSDYQTFRDEPVRSWKEVNKEVADNPGMGSMKHGPGMTMPGMESKPGDAAKAKDGAARHDMGSMQHKPGAAMPGMDAKTGSAPKAKGSAAGHDMGAMKGMQGHTVLGKDKPAASAPPKSKDGHAMTAMVKPQSAPGQTTIAPVAGIAGTGVVQSIDKANAKVKLTHEPIAAMGWPKMTMIFRLKERSLAEQVKEGDKVGFTLEKTASGYVISGFQKPATESTPAANVSKPAAHGKH